WLDKEVGAISKYGGDVRLAVLLSLLSLVALGFGMRVGAGPWRQEIGTAIRSTASAHPPKAWFKLYCAAFLLAFAAQSFAWVVPGLSQPLLALASIKWAAYWM